MAKGMMIYEAEMEVLLSLEEENRSHIITSLICGRLGKEAPNLNPMENAVFTLIREQTKRSAKLSDTRSDSVNERWKKRENCIQYETTEEQDSNNQGNSKGLDICFPHSPVSSCPIVKSPNRLASLGNPDADCHKYHINLGDNPDTCQGNIRSIHRSRSIIPQRIIHRNLHHSHGNLIDTSRHPKRCNRFQTCTSRPQHIQRQFHLTESGKI